MESAREEGKKRTGVRRKVGWRCRRQEAWKGKSARWKWKTKQ